MTDAQLREWCSCRARVLALRIVGSLYFATTLLLLAHLHGQVIAERRGAGTPLWLWLVWFAFLLLLGIFVEFAWGRSGGLGVLPSPSSRTAAAEGDLAPSSPNSTTPAPAESGRRRGAFTPFECPSHRGATPPRGRSLSPHPTPRADRVRVGAIQGGHRGDQAPAASEIAASTAGSAGARARLIPDAFEGATPSPAPTLRPEPRT